MCVAVKLALLKIWTAPVRITWSRHIVLPILDCCLDSTVPSKIHGQRKFPLEVHQPLNRTLDKMEKDLVIARVMHPTDWVNSLVLREKRDGSLRICLDPTNLNRAIKRDHHPVPTLEEITPRLCGAAVFSKLDARNGYWHVRLDEESSYLTTFNTPFGRYSYLRMPFGLCMSQDVFQRHIDDTYRGCNGVIGIADDLVIYGTNAADHDIRLHEAMERTRLAGAKLNFDKCEVKRSEIQFFGNVYTSGGVKPDPERVRAIHEMEAPQSKQELHTFIGMITYMGPYITHLSDHTAPLRELLKQDVVFQWSESHQRAFDSIKSLISEDAKLRYYDRSRPITLQVDASAIGLGACLIQDGAPVAYASKSLTATEQRYANIERELLAVVFGCNKFHTYLCGRQFTVESDHRPLEQIYKKNLFRAPPRLQRMLLKLQPYNMTITYKPGKQVLIADALSRLTPCDQEEIPGMDVLIHEVVDQQPSSIDCLRKHTSEDEELQLLQQQIITGWPDSIKKVHSELRPYWSVRDDLYVQDGLLLMGTRVIIPKSQRESALQQLHQGHLGMEKCKLRAKETVYWPGIYKDLEARVSSCTACQKHQNSKPREPMISMEVPPRPWHTVGADLFHFANTWYLIVSDYYSKCPFIRKLSNLTARAVIGASKSIFTEHGTWGHDLRLWYPVPQPRIHTLLSVLWLWDHNLLTTLSKRAWSHRAACWDDKESNGQMPGRWLRSPVGTTDPAINPNWLPDPIASGNSEWPPTEN